MKLTRDNNRRHWALIEDRKAYLEGEREKGKLLKNSADKNKLQNKDPKKKQLVLLYIMQQL